MRAYVQCDKTGKMQSVLGVTGQLSMMYAHAQEHTGMDHGSIGVHWNE